MTVQKVTRCRQQVTVHADEGTFAVQANSPAALLAAADENAERRRQQWNAGLRRERLYREAAAMWEAQP